MTKEELNSMEIQELLELRERINKRLYEKLLMTGYKDGFNDAVKSERNRYLILLGEDKVKEKG